MGIVPVVNGWTVLQAASLARFVSYEMHATRCVFSFADLAALSSSDVEVPAWQLPAARLAARCEA